MSITYEIAVRLLGSRNTHLKLRDRARFALQQLQQESVVLPPDFMQRVSRAIYLRNNAVSYEQRHFPGWQSLPAELREGMEERYPVSGYGMTDINTMLYLQRQAKEAEAELTIEHGPDPEDAAIDQMVEDYLAWRKEK